MISTRDICIHKLILYICWTRRYEFILYTDARPGDMNSYYIDVRPGDMNSYYIDIRPDDKNSYYIDVRLGDMNSYYIQMLDQAI